MASLSCDDIYSSFLGYIKDNNLLAQEYSSASAFMSDWLKKSYSKPYVRRLFSSISYDEDQEEITYSMKFSVDDDTDKDFVVDMLALGMVVAWLSPILRSKVNLAQKFGGSEQKFYSQAAHIAELREVCDDAKIEQRNLIRDRGYIYNSYLEG